MKIHPSNSIVTQLTEHRGQYWPTSGGRSNEKLTHFVINNQDPSKILKIFPLRSFFYEMTYSKNK